ncbi:hypothetical protein [Xylocopilactobacillus apis]|uniref:Uncharacterized protein n=1 Tax=Xylocopilactobacillus apis TaxID=2932183 RepID=A0AAU9D5B9_9LACO|nr:hypothetical protein [Xylocopilactobacillus apis]BDR56012.1 hypothetical protein KIMC2_05740 [Xylocopilactobacillus apis]
MIGSIIAYIYAALFAFAASYTMFTTKKMPIWLYILNILAAVLIVLNFMSIIWLILGLGLALYVGVLNGKITLGKVHPSHFLVKIVISTIIVLMVYRKI